MKKQIKILSLYLVSLGLFMLGLPSFAEESPAEAYPYEGLSLSVSAFAEDDSISADGKAWKTLRGTVEGNLLTHGELRYHVYLPESFRPSKTYPMVVYLHGAGATYKRYPTHTPWTQTINADLTKLADALSETVGDCIIFAPHAPGGETTVLPGSAWTQADGKAYVTSTEDKSGPSYYLKAVANRMHDYITNGIPYLENTYRVNTKRIYLIGDSAGAMGAYTLLGECPSLFAAAIVRAGLGDPDAVSAWKDTPIRIFHGTADKTVTYEGSTKMIAALQNAGAKDAKLITIENGPHDIRYFAYQTLDKNGNNVYLGWLSKQSRGATNTPLILAIGGAVLFFLCIAIMLLHRFRHRS